ncbi:MAG: inverse autotransporter beta domain-containing protein [Fuerstiella sp.]|nr:inverse autotransporter beta domain-containing protein [Fuerstiella sp.]
MGRKSFLIGIVFLLLGSASHIAQAQIQTQVWRPYIDMEARGDSFRWLGQGNLFVPLIQDRDSMLFADLRGHWTDNSTSEGNWGLAYRKILPSQWIVGAYGFLDYQNSRFNNDYFQGTAGLELLSVDRGFRINGYIPGEGANATPFSSAFLQGGNVVVRPVQERAYGGVDFEAERLLWFRDAASGSSGWSPNNLDAEIWAAAGVFHFDNDAANFESITGPRLRAELRLYDLPILGNDSRLVISGQYEHDDVRGSVGTGMLTMRIPFGPCRGRCTRRLKPMDRRMVTPIVRDIDIITNTGQGVEEPAKFALTGQPISQAITIDGNTVDPEGVIEGAGADSLVIAEGSAGTIIPAGTVDMDIGQVVLGGGSGVTVVGCNTGAMANFIAPGTRPTINNSFVVNSGGGLIGLDINGQGTTAAVNLIGAGDFEISHSNITNVDNGLTDNVTQPSGYDVDIAEMGIFGQGSAINLAIRNSTVSTTTNESAPSYTSEALYLSPTSGNINVTDSLLTADRDCVDIQTYGSGTVTANFLRTTMTSVNGDVIEYFEPNDGTTLIGTFDNVVISGRRGIGNFRAGDDTTMIASFTDSQILGGTSEAINNMYVNGPSAKMTVSFENVDIISTGNDAINNLFCGSYDGATLHATFTNNLIQGYDRGIGYPVAYRGTGTFTFTGNTIIGETGEAIGRLGSTETGKCVATFTDNTITSIAADAVDGETSETSNSSIIFANNTLSSPDGFFDFNLNQTDTSTFNVVDFGNLSGNNNGASVTTSGAITDIPALP